MSERFSSPEYLIADAVGHYGVLHIALPAFPQFADQMQKHVDTIRKYANPELLTEIAKANGQNTEAEWFIRLQEHAFNER